MDDRTACVSYEEFMKLLRHQSEQLGGQLNVPSDEYLLKNLSTASLEKVEFEGPESETYAALVRRCADIIMIYLTDYER